MHVCIIYLVFFGQILSMFICTALYVQRLILVNECINIHIYLDDDADKHFSSLYYWYVVCVYNKYLCGYLDQCDSVNGCEQTNLTAQQRDMLEWANRWPSTTDWDGYARCLTPLDCSFFGIVSWVLSHLWCLCKPKDWDALTDLDFLVYTCAYYTLYTGYSGLVFNLYVYIFVHRYMLSELYVSTYTYAITRMYMTMYTAKSASKTCHIGRFHLD